MNFDSPTSPLHLCTLVVSVKSSNRRFERLDPPVDLLKPCFRTIPGEDQERAVIARLEKFLKDSEQDTVEQPTFASEFKVQVPVASAVVENRRPEMLKRNSSVNDDEFSRKANAITKMKDMTAAPEETCMFVLESCEWNVEAAIKMYQELYA